MIFDSSALSQCVGCGLCLPSCPTYQVTREERHGPRGRIAGMRLVQSGEVRLTDPAYVESMETCVQCRACEPACPSGVRFGSLMSQARGGLYRRPEAAGGFRRLRRALTRGLTDLALRVLGAPRVLRVLSAVLSLAQGTRLQQLLPVRWRVPHRVRLRDLVRPLRSEPGSRTAHLFRGCVMDAWFRPVHEATARVLTAAGYAVRMDPAPACCGAVHLHAGRIDQARVLARQVVAAYRGSAGDIVVNSAGCGAAMREYGQLLGTPEADDFASRVRDFSEVLRAEDLPPLRPLELTVAYQAACHLKNVQGVDAEVRRLLAAIPSLEVKHLEDGDLCCGAGGAYSLFQPEFAAAIRGRKRESLAETGASVVVSGNPGCILHLEGAGFRVVHTAELLASALPRVKAGMPAIERVPTHAGS